VTLPAGYQAQFDHVAAPRVQDRRAHSRLVAGSAAPLFLDMWVAAIKELDAQGDLDATDKTVAGFIGLDAPQHSQMSLSTRDAWLHYQALPNRRAFQFMTTLPPPILDIFKDAKGLGLTPDKILMSELNEAQSTSLYTSFSRPFVLDVNNLYRRDTNEPIKLYLDAGLELVTIAERVRGYFLHEEAKSQGTTGLLTRKCVAGLSKVWIGKESHPLADTEDLPDDETLEHYKAEGRIFAGALNHDMITQAGEEAARRSLGEGANGSLDKAAWQRGISEVAKAARIDEHALVDAVLSRKSLGADEIARIAAALSIAPNGSVVICDAPKTRQETAVDRISRILLKGKKLRELEQFIYSALNGATEHAKIFRDLVEISTYRKPPWHLPLKDIEAFAKRFYGIDARIAKQTVKKERQAEFFKTTAENARTRFYKGRDAKRTTEIEQIAARHKLPEIKDAKDIKHAHALDKILNHIAEEGFKPVKIISSPHLKNNSLRCHDGSPCPHDFFELAERPCRPALAAPLRPASRDRRASKRRASAPY
jgi:hypothetical protein